MCLDSYGLNKKIKLSDSFLLFSFLFFALKNRIFSRENLSYCSVKGLKEGNTVSIEIKCFVPKIKQKVEVVSRLQL